MMNAQQHQVFLMPMPFRTSQYRERTTNTNITPNQRRDPPRRTLLDTFVERDDTYWVMMFLFLQIPT
jgi:hypothetical protein